MTHKIVLVFVAAASLLAPSTAATAAPVTVDSTFTFTGNCTIDCTGTAHATLVLSDYALGSSFTSSNFVSLTYQSNFMSFSVTPTQDTILSTTNGTFTPPLPGAEGVFIAWQVPGNSLVMILQTFTSGSWCADTALQCSDAGNNAVWTETPLPAALPLFATGLGALGLLGWRRKRKAKVA
jgi:hypothetical protein